ncbi:unnamed protein product [Leptidea sinapis]|uniref:RBR-type E3 ubiquitin transferase n=1 Tax=Leptidea sinapis TaxID=189913 RepID=A0A5E4QJ73_9NEOP|nr:unnamed protein product [Leptidea sinapis]
MDSEDDTKDDVDSGNESSGDDVDFVMDETHSTRERQTELEEYPYEVLSTEEIVQHMVDCIKEVNTVVEIPATTTRILLNHFKWDKEKLMERFYDGDQDQLFAEARVINPFRKPVTQRPKIMTGLECGHRFCTQCWCEYLTTKIMEEGLCNRLLRWCPSPDCSNAIKVAYVEAAPVTCRCTHTFCFACGENWHDPVRCCLLRKWIKSLRFESKLYASVKEKMEEMQQHNMSWIESVIFEDNQRDLESATETLSEYLERDITSENLADIKQKVQDKYR